MTGPWFEVYEAATARGARMRVHTHGCSCLNCRFGHPTAAQSDSVDEDTGGAWDRGHDQATDIRNEVW
ncbi:hypothetical protein ACQPW1_00300 [Nocardia sp. CA-128927]|uniref:hypothetical protein n=1 Tax=Nocardia sp. CA-128927 TaxID=3239975 RepID=UPI003D95922B